MISAAAERLKSVHDRMVRKEDKATDREMKRYEKVDILCKCFKAIADVFNDGYAKGLTNKQFRRLKTDLKSVGRIKLDNMAER